MFLESVLPQFDNDIEILICDDSPNELTTDIVKKFCTAFPIRYKKRIETKGVDSALLELLQDAKGNYVWWFGDDILLPGAINRIRSFIQSNEDLSFLWINSEDETNSDSKTFGDAPTHLFKEKDELLDFDIGLLGFISAVIFKRNLANNALASAEKYIGSSFFSLYITLNVIAEATKLGLLGESSFTSLPKPSGEVRWYDQIEVFGINLFLICKENGRGFSRKALNRALSRNMTRVLKAMIVEKALGHTTGFANVQFRPSRLIGIYWNSPKFWTLYLPLLTPQWILAFLYKSIIGRKRKAFK